MATATIVNTLDFTRKLKAAGIPAEHAEAIADALNDVAMSEVATRADIAAVRSDLREMESRLVVKLGGVVAALIALLFAALKLS